MKQSSQAGILLAGLFAAACIYIYPLFLPTPLLEPDEGLHAAISQEMLEHNEWLVPTFRGEPFLDKPILFFWAQMVSMKTFGMNELGVRFPGLMFGLLGALTTGLLAARLFGARTGMIAGLMGMTMFIPLALAQFAAHDVALVPWTNLALLSLWETEKATNSQQRFLWMSAAAGMFGLAILTKALIGVAIVAVGYGLFLLLGRRLSVGAVVRFAAVLSVGAVVASPWYIAMELRSSGYLYYYFIERHLMGFATSSQPHGRSPFWLYIPIITLGAMPWFLYTVPLLLDEWRGRNQQGGRLPTTLLVLCWLIGGVLFLTLAKSKLVTYALPLFPAVAILTAVSWQRFTSKTMSESSSTWFSNISRMAGIAGIFAPFGVLILWQVLLHRTWPAYCWAAACGIAAVSLRSMLAFEKARYDRSLCLCCTWVGLMALMIMTWPIQAIAEEHSQRSLAQWLNQQDELPEHLVLVDETPASVIFYLQPVLRESIQTDQFERIDLVNMESGGSLDSRVVMAVAEEYIEFADEQNQKLPGVAKVTAGHYQIFESELDHKPIIQTAHGTEETPVQ
ncbi:MAG: glycosyltransferase family 39 protein [Fuerstiella sp.]